jgi:hypothetical protein
LPAALLLSVKELEAEWYVCDDERTTLSIGFNAGCGSFGVGVLVGGGSTVWSTPEISKSLIFASRRLLFTYLCSLKAVTPSSVPMTPPTNSGTYTCGCCIASNTEASWGAPMLPEGGAVWVVVGVDGLLGLGLTVVLVVVGGAVDWWTRAVGSDVEEAAKTVVG